MIITSLENNKIKDLVKLQSKKYRDSTNMFLVEGEHLVEEVNKSNLLKEVFVLEGDSFNIDKWYKKQAKKIFQERLDYQYDKYTRKIPYPKLRIRKMTTRWGVCNIKTHYITLNLELIKRDIKYLDYVAVHELTHLVYANHSKYFWDLVEENLPGHKKYRKEMKEFL